MMNALRSSMVVVGGLEVFPDTYAVVMVPGAT